MKDSAPLIWMTDNFERAVGTETSNMEKGHLASSFEETT